MTLSKEHDKLFVDLKALNEQQIEVGLAAGVWNEQVSPVGPALSLRPQAQTSGSGG